METNNTNLQLALSLTAHKIAARLCEEALTLTAEIGV